ncbi:MAG: hypothetical protein IBX71_03955 [Candidatus Desulforudis sp.]|nr:hypothetical protein [Desulforudis sp.]
MKTIRVKKRHWLCFCLPILFLMLITAGCRQAEVPTAPDTVALVNGMEITTEDIQRQIVQREVESAISNYLLEYEAHTEPEITEERRPDYEKLVRRLGLEPNQLTKEQDYSLRSYFLALSPFESTEPTPDELRYFQRIIRELPESGMDENAAFNHLVRQVVLYRKAVEHGHEVDLDEAQDILAQADALEQDAPDELQAQMEEMRRLETEVLRGHDYRREEWREANLPRYARKITINHLRAEFDEALYDRHPEAMGFRLQVLMENAWEDYTEQLVRQADIRIIDDQFELVYYSEHHGENWLDLMRREPEDVAKTRRQADLNVDGEATPAEVQTIAAIIDRRLRHLGAEQISVGVDGHRLQVEAWWEEDIPWAQLARRGLLQIGADHELSLTNEHLENAVAERRPMTSSYGVLLEFNGQGTELFAELTLNNVGRNLPIHLDGKPLANPVVQSPVTDGRAVVTLPDWDKAETMTLAAVLSTEPLPKSLVLLAD